MTGYAMEELIGKTVGQLRESIVILQALNFCF
ncbi:hypothetical protein [Vreelandella venusta]